MRIEILYIGRDKTRLVEDAVKEYTKRLSRWVEFSWRPLPAAAGSNLSADESRSKESAVLIAAIKPDDYVVLLDERGRQLTNGELANLIDQQVVAARARVVFIIGGAYGVSEDMRTRADIVWSLSKLVFPHELMRVIVAEQLYRTFTILHNQPYHH